MEFLDYGAPEVPSSFDARVRKVLARRLRELDDYPVAIAQIAIIKEAQNIRHIAETTGSTLGATLAEALNDEAPYSRASVSVRSYSGFLELIIEDPARGTVSVAFIDERAELEPELAATVEKLRRRDNAAKRLMH